MLNKCEFIGRLGSDPDVKYSQQGTAIASFSLATTETWKDQAGQKMEKTEWIRCVAFKRLAEIIGEYLSKGSLIYLSGQLNTRKWQDKDGNDRYTTEIIAREMKMLGGGSNGGGQQQESYEPPEMGGDVPF